MRLLLIIVSLLQGQKKGAFVLMVTGIVGTLILLVNFNQFLSTLSDRFFFLIAIKRIQSYEMAWSTIPACCLYNADCGGYTLPFSNMGITI